MFKKIKDAVVMVFAVIALVVIFVVLMYIIVMAFAAGMSHG